VTRHKSVKEARDNFADVLGLVYYGKELAVVERKGRPTAVLISPEQWDRIQQQTKVRLAVVTRELWRENAEQDYRTIGRQSDRRARR